ncbi:MAG: site-specific integrase [Acidaminococcus provencensis]|jgi:integrase|uniref:site-specific integrase n=1 Tax=Acidaminococcus provencensis TaxID=2058289 RepID=UPI0023F11E29|nr:site-specific integrase [Acidaminococcus provencensis]MCH4095128.1 site-specific integrase [Acidaminococcus provencensis]
MEYSFSYREKNGSVCLILSYKVGKRWKQKTKQGFKTQREARKYQDTLLAQVKETAGLTDDIRLKDISLRDFFPIFVRDRENALAYNTLRNYHDGIANLGSVADIPIRDLTTAEIINALMASECKPSSRKSRLRFITPVLEHALKMYNIIKVNPAKGIKLPMDKAPKTLRAFTRAELAALLKLLEPWPLRHLVVTLGAGTGMRFGEIAGLPWAAIDWDKQAITVQQQYAQSAHNQYSIGPCKTANSNRVIPASAAVLQELKAWKKTQPMTITGTVFPLDRMPTERTSINTLIRKHFPGRSLHALRHTFATLLLSRTGDINLVAHVLGDTVGTVSSIYVNYTEDINQVAVKAIGSLY